MSAYVPHHPAYLVFHPDYTVGPGIPPDQSLLVKGVADYYRR